MRVISVNARRHHDEPYSDDDEIAFVHLTHPDLAEPIRVSSDPTDRLSLEPELYYGTRSTWMSSSAQPYLFVGMDIILPDRSEMVPTNASLALHLIDASIARALHKTIIPATVHMAVAMRSTPNYIEAQWRRMELKVAEGDGGIVKLNFDRTSFLEEPWPFARMTKERYPGLFA